MGINGISPLSLLLILLIVIVLFGSARLKNLGSDMGQIIRQFRRALNEDDKKP